jgi:hypothetical protein
MTYTPAERRALRALQLRYVAARKAEIVAMGKGNFRLARTNAATCSQIAAECKALQERAAINTAQGKQTP